MILALRRFAPGPFAAGALAEACARLLTALRAQAVADRMCWPLWLPVAMGAGIGLYFALPGEPVWAFAVVAAGLALAAGTLSVAAAHRAVLRIVLALLAAASLGFAVAKLRTEIVRAPVLTRKLRPAGIDGRVAFVQAHGKSIRVTLGAVVARRLPPDRTPALVRVWCQLAGSSTCAKRT
jgi:competence protein ComEC